MSYQLPQMTNSDCISYLLSEKDKAMNSIRRVDSLFCDLPDIRDSLIEVHNNTIDMCNRNLKLLCYDVN